MKPENATEGRAANHRGASGVASAPSESFTVLHQFVPAPNSPFSKLIQASDGNFYGTTFNGGDTNNGAVFQINASGTITILHSFMGSDGAHPSAALVEGSDGNFYGTTRNGGVSDNGTVFKITRVGVVTTLHSFTGSDGANPFSELIAASDGNFYGTAEGGNAEGTVFQITPSGGFTLLHTFQGSDGAQPTGALALGDDGSFYGTTFTGGDKAFGTVFKITAAGDFTSLHSFMGADGTGPIAGLLKGGDGSFYGTTYGNIQFPNGTVFKVSPLGNVTTIHSFSGTDGASPRAGLIVDQVGNFYGTTENGGALNAGTAFEITASGTFRLLHSFSGTDGQKPLAAVVLGSDGNLYGTTSAGGTDSGGTVFQLTSVGVLTTLYNFGAGDGIHPISGVVHGSDGNFYGTTFAGGASNDGTLFKMTAAGEVTTLYAFSGNDGAGPYGRLIQGSDGNLYGTTEKGGPAGDGTVFKISTSGALTTLHFFSGPDGAHVFAGLIEGADGDFYGTTAGGGLNSSGTVYKITSTGVLTTLYSFAGSDGADPYAPLVQGTSGSFYGTTVNGGAANHGTIFSMTSSGSLTTLHSFSGIDGASPFGQLLEAGDGSFYGTTCFGGPDFDPAKNAFGSGEIFNVKKNGDLDVVYPFSAGGGANPFAGLIKARDGSFYGTTEAGGADNDGVVFKLTPSHKELISHDFNGSGDGQLPTALLAQDSDGSLYGTTSAGGSAQTGIIFRFTPMPPIQLENVVSRKVHGEAGAFDVDLTAGSGIECRSGGPGGDYRLVFTFTNPLDSVGGANLTSGRATVSSASINSSDARQYIVDLTGVNNAQLLTVTVHDVSDSAGNSISSVSGEMQVLLGDVNGDGVVDSADVDVTKAHQGENLTGGNFRDDVTSDGIIDCSDVAVVERASGSTAEPCPSPTATPIPSPTATPTASPSATASPHPTESPNPSPSPSLTPSPSATSTPTPTPTASPSQQPSPAPQLLNISTRADVLMGDSAAIAGFIVTGNSPKRVILRAIGPSMNVNGQPVPGRLADPTLELRDATGVLIDFNDNWTDSPQSIEITLAGLAPSDDRESAISQQLSPGKYTAIIRGKNDTTGIGLVEVYDRGSTGTSKLANISTRGVVETSDNVMIGGFIVGNNQPRTKVIVRAIGPSLATQNVPTPLQDPLLEVHDGNGNLFASNDNWQTDPGAAEIQNDQLAPADPRESATLQTLQPGNYTAIVRGVDNTTGVGLIEVYNVQ